MKYFRYDSLILYRPYAIAFTRSSSSYTGALGNLAFYYSPSPQQDPCPFWSFYVCMHVARASLRFPCSPSVVNRHLSGSLVFFKCPLFYVPTSLFDQLTSKQRHIVANLLCRQIISHLNTCYWGTTCDATDTRRAQMYTRNISNGLFFKQRLISQ